MARSAVPGNGAGFPARTEKTETETGYALSLFFGRGVPADFLSRLGRRGFGLF